MLAALSWGVHEAARWSASGACAEWPAGVPAAPASSSLPQNIIIIINNNQQHIDKHINELTYFLVFDSFEHRSNPPAQTSQELAKTCFCYVGCFNAATAGRRSFGASTLARHVA